MLKETRNLTTPEEMGPDVILSRPPEPSCVTFKFSEGCIAVVDIVVRKSFLKRTVYPLSKSG